MENSDRSRVRKYRKSSVPRLRWTPALHHHFVQAVQTLGGKYKATPKKIMQMMAVRGLQISHIKSHLQMYRSMKESNMDPDGFIAIRNYQEKISDCITLLPIRQVSQGIRRKLTIDHQKLCLHQFHQDKKEITAITQKDDDDANTMKLTSDHHHGHINLDLTLHHIH